MSSFRRGRRVVSGAVFVMVAAGCTAPTGATDEPSESSASELRDACGVRYVSVRGSDVSAAGASSDCRAPRAPCRTVQRGVDAACAGDTVRIGRGDYAENVVVPKSLTLDGARGAVVRPARSAPTPCADGSLCGGAASTIILVQASGVTVRGLTLDGDNPALTSGVVVGGADVDARNGIVTDHDRGRFDGLEVEDVRVENVYLRGVEASTGGTFRFRRVFARNVLGDAQSVAVFNFGGAGSITDTEVVDSADAISANHSRGTLFARNVVRRSASGIHTDNAGDSAGSATDRIEDNRVADCAVDGFGAWVFVPFVAPLVRHNAIERCAIGLAAFGQGASVRTAFVDNRVRAGTEAGSVGAFVTTDQIGFGAANVSVLFFGNVLRGAETGLAVEEGPGFVADAELTCNTIRKSTTGIVATSVLGRVSGNAITGNALGLDATAIASGLLDARRNWWGCGAGPGAPGCDPVSGSVDVSSPLAAPPRCAAARLAEAEAESAPDNSPEDAATDIVPDHGATSQAKRAAGRSIAVPRGGGGRSQ